MGKEEVLKGGMKWLWKGDEGEVNDSGNTLTGNGKMLKDLKGDEKVLKMIESHQWATVKR